MNDQNESLRSIVSNLATRRTSLTETERNMAAAVLEKMAGLELAIKELKQGKVKALFDAPLKLQQGVVDTTQQNVVSEE